tara:strand:- start:575 stop:739 length:165 start_codon:yes stop_codon:yes gene_type:complete
MEAHMKFIKTIIFGFTVGFVAYYSFSGSNGINLDDSLLNDKELDAVMNLELPQD